MNKKHLIIGFSILGIAILCCTLALCIDLSDTLNKAIAIFSITILPFAEYEIVRGFFDI